MKRIVLAGIKLYKKSEFLRTPFLKAAFGTAQQCRFQPTCSEYFYQAVEKYGVLKGSYLGIKRILRCHPWSKGGLDPLN